MFYTNNHKISNIDNCNIKRNGMRHCLSWECIFGLIKQTRAVDNDGKACIPCLDYKEVVLTAAECLYHTGNTAKAKEYVDLMSKKKSISVDGSDLLKSIATLRYKLQLPNYLTFIRRNDLGTSFMGLSANQTSELLWPIPFRR